MKALLIIDMQQSTATDPRKHDIQGVLQRINLLSAKARSQNDLVIFIQHDGCAAEHLEPHSKGWQIASALQQNATDIIIRKTTNDAFAGTHLTSVLQRNNITQLIITGWATDFCVDSTVKSAFNKNYQITIAEDCHTLNDREHISAQHAIAYFNWLWSNMLPSGRLSTKTTNELLNTL